MAIGKNYEYKFERGSLRLRAVIPPYVWMYHGGKVDVDIYDETNTNIRVCGLAINMADNTAEELNKLVEAIPIEEAVCKTCNTHILKRSSECRQVDECEQCCLARLSAEWEVEAAKMREEEKKVDIDAFKKGYRYRTDMWVHPSRGDDYMLSMHSVVKPTDAEIVAILKRKKSRVFDDFKIVEITEKGMIGEVWT